jgi:hypothetical protein
MTQVAKGLGSICVACVTVAIASAAIISLAVIIWTQFF